MNHYPRTRNEVGFTIMEMMVVVGIIGILSAIAIPSFLNSRRAAVDNDVRNDITAIALKLKTHVAMGHADTPPSFSFTHEGDTPIGSVQVGGEKTTITVVGLPGKNYEITGTNPDGDASVSGITYKNAEGGLPAR